MEDYIPSVDPTAAADLHPLDLFEQLRTATMPQASKVGGVVSLPHVPTPPALKSGGGAPAGDGWRGLLQMLAPVVGGLAMGGGVKQTGFLNGYAQGQQIAAEDRRQKAEDEQKKSVVAANYLQKVAEQADQITDPVQHEQFVNTADMAGAKAGFTQPGEIKGQVLFDSRNMARQQLSDLSKQLDAFEKGGYNLDDLAQSGAVVKLKDGTAVPIGTALDLTRGRPLMGGKPVARPSKQDVNASTDFGRFLSKYAKDAGKTVADLTTAEELDAKTKYNLAGDKPAAPPHVGSGSVDAQFNDLVELWKTGNPGKEIPADVRMKLRVQAKKEIGQADDRPQTLSGMNSLYEQADPKAIADAIIRGEREPDTGNLGRPIGAAVDSALAKAGYNKAAALTDWKATQRHVATMNNGQQLRLNQSINALPDLLDSVDTLAAQWQGGRFPLLNKANLALAKGGAYGTAAATIANKLETQIADVTADLGNVYMGGNSPTDHALALAGTALKGEWDAKVLRDMVKLARANVTIRKNSIANTGVAGASATNPYAPKTPEPSTPPPAGPVGLTYQDYLKSKGKG